MVGDWWRISPIVFSDGVFEDTAGGRVEVNETLVIRSRHFSLTASSFSVGDATASIIGVRSCFGFVKGESGLGDFEER